MNELVREGAELPQSLEEVVQVEAAPTRQAGISHLRVLAFAAAGDAPREVEWAAVPDLLRAEQHFIWADLSEYSAPDLAAVATVLGLRRSTIHTINSTWQRPTLANLNEYFFVSATIPRLNTQGYRILAGELDLCVSRRFVLSAHRQPLPFGEQLWARALQNPDLVQRDPAYLLYLMLDELLIYDEDLNRHIQNQSELLEEQALSDVGDAFLEDLLHFKRYIFGLTELIDQHREVFTGFFRPDFSGVTGEEVEGHFRDLQVRLAHLLSMLNAAKESVISAFNIYVSHMSHRTNQIIKVLTMVSTILLPATLIVALFGSSVQSELPGLRSMWFWLMLGSIVALCGSIVVVFMRQGWIAPRRTPNSLRQ
ncbi:MAG: hypothetical protein H0X24_16790 [Ktedonobacterales bacterium]|nr:hypothetical protein [Ktedonobacterales bacterium]